jgi:hypothetical protein
MKLLLALPFFGDYGWMLCRWIPHLRFLSHRYDATCVWMSHENEWLCHDFATPIEKIHPKGDCCDCDADVFVLRPGQEFNRGPLEVEFVKYGKHDRVWASDLVIHARADSRGVIGENRNWPVERWQELIQRLRDNSMVRTVIGVGSLEAAVHVPGARDMRGVDARLLIDIMASTRLCIGPSSGPMHLASLCGARHLVWSDQRVWNLGSKKGTNRERYENIWNPLGTPATVFDSQGWQPEVDAIQSLVERLLQ